jgi:hypothetical protein
VSKWLGRWAALWQHWVRIRPGTPPLVQRRKIQEHQCRFSPAQQQACQPITKDKYCIIDIDQKSSNFTIKFLEDESETGEDEGEDDDEYEDEDEDDELGPPKDRK